MNTFRHWPPAMPQTARQLAYAGFFYLGVGDHVQCFHCSGALKNWDAEDLPWVEHARWFGNCPYLLLKQGQAFVQHVKEDRPLTQEMLANFEERPQGACRPVAVAVQQPPIAHDVLLLDAFNGPALQDGIHQGRTDMDRLRRENESLRNEQQCKVCMDAEIQVCALDDIFIGT